MRAILIELVDLVILSVAAFCTAALSAVTGAGGGASLLVIMLQFISPAAAIPVHGAVQLSANITRVWLLRHHLYWKIILRFAILLPLGAVVGTLMFQNIPTAFVQKLIGCFVLVALSLPHLKFLKGREVKLWAFIPIGFITGILNMIVGAIGPVLAVLMIRKDLSKEQIVGTLGVFGLTGSFVKIVGFVAIGFSFAEYGPLMIAMIPSVMIGAKAGNMMLKKLDERYFRILFHIVLIALSLKLIFSDGIGQM